MLLVLHIIIALTGLIYSGYLIFRPVANGIKIAGGLIGLTLLSGTYLSVASQAPLTSACLSGLIYTGFTLSCLIAAYRRLPEA